MYLIAYIRAHNVQYTIHFPSGNIWLILLKFHADLPDREIYIHISDKNACKPMIAKGFPCKHRTLRQNLEK
jgi:hypothetical protein